MRFVVDCDASWKFNSHCGARARTLRLLDGWDEVEALVLECSAQRLLYTRKIPSTVLSPRGKTSALKMFKGTTENEPAIFARSRSRSHVQNVIAVCPCSGATFHFTAGASGN